MFELMGSAKTHVNPCKYRAGGVAEWLKATVLKTVEPQGSGGSNPSSSVHHFPLLRYKKMVKLDPAMRMAQKPHVTSADIEAGFRSLGLGRGHCVGVHSALSSFGYVEGGADAVIDALLRTVGPEGTVVLPTYSQNKQEVELTDEDRRLGIWQKRRNLPYDPKRDACWTGRIAETFWRRSEAIRGDNPTHSLAAIGPRAADLCQGWDRVLEADGYILLLGVTLSCCSSMHQAEFRVDNIPQSPDPPEALKQLKEKYESEGLWVYVKYPGMLCYPDFAKLEEPCRRCGVMRATQIGEAEVKLFRLTELIDLYAQYLKNRPEMFYHT